MESRGGSQLIAAELSAQNLAGKKVCKRTCSRISSCLRESGRPLIGIVSRFADQKGFDLMAEIADEMMKENVALVVLGNRPGRV